MKNSSAKQFFAMLLLFSLFFSICMLINENLTGVLIFAALTMMFYMVYVILDLEEECKNEER